VERLRTNGKRYVREPHFSVPRGQVSHGSVAMADGSSCALESFLQLAKVARGLAAARVVSDATSAPAVFAFGELLDAPHIQEVRWLALLGAA